MRTHAIACLIPTVLALGGSRAVAAYCDPLPPINPNGTFISNFANACYAIPFTAGSGTSSFGDANAEYETFYYVVNPAYELIVLGTFPNARFLSATVYDTHTAITNQMLDQQFVPLTNSMTNPFVVGAQFVPNQQYAFRISLGGGLPVQERPGCSTAKFNLNFLDASMIHSGLTWTGYSGLPPGFPAHITGPNTGGQFLIRRYVDISHPPVDQVILRDLSTGCAVPAAQALSMKIIQPVSPKPSPLFDLDQVSDHVYFSQTIKAMQCYPADPHNSVRWYRPRDFIQIDNGGSAGLAASFTSTQLAPVLAGTSFIRIEFKAPAYPNTPCSTGSCSLTGNEDLRYYSMSFQQSSTTITSIKDSDMVQDPNGNITIIASMGAIPPPQVTAANYYTYIDLTKFQNYQNIGVLLLRNFLNNPNFMCSAFNGPYHTMEYNSGGGFMGQYVPTVDFPTAAKIPITPVPPTRPDSCTYVPPPPTDCPPQPGDSR